MDFAAGRRPHSSFFSRRCLDVRKRQMRKNRAKSCFGCREAKARCSQQTPCQRCSKRDLICIYASVRSVEAASGNAQLRAIRPAAHRFRLNSGCRINERGLSTDFTSSNASGADQLGLAGEVVAAATHNIPQNEPRESAVTARGESVHLLRVQPSLSPEIHDTEVASRSCGQEGTLDPADILSGSTNPGPQLLQRGRSLQQGSLTARMLVSKLAEYTRMMASCKKLPPFIYPPCISSGERVCIATSTHLCLPPTLSKCARLTNDFHTHDSERSRSATWQAICNHLRSMHSEVWPMQEIPNAIKRYTELLPVYSIR